MIGHQLGHITLQHINVFFALVETKSFTLAAQKLSMTQPNISKNLARLEAILGFSLMDRQKRAIRPTERGEICYREWKHFVSTFHLGYQSALEQDDTKKELNIGIDFTLSYEDCSAVFRDKDRSSVHPLSSFVINIYEDTPKVLDWKLEEGELDMILVPDFYRHNIDTKKFNWKPLLTTNPHLLMTSDHPMASREFVYMRDLVDEPMVVFDPFVISPIKMDICAMFESLGATPSIQGYYKSTHELQAILQSSYCVTIVGSFFTFKDSPRFKRIPILDQHSSVIYQWKKQYIPNRVATFLELIQ